MLAQLRPQATATSSTGARLRGAGSLDDTQPLRHPHRPRHASRVGDQGAVDRAVAAARRGFAPWSGRPWAERCAILRRAADLIEERGFELSALAQRRGRARTGWRRWATSPKPPTSSATTASRWRRTRGFDRPMGQLHAAGGDALGAAALRRLGVISPFNFPAALAGGPASGALVAGNTVVLKPSAEAPLAGLRSLRGLPRGGRARRRAAARVRARAQPARPLADHPGVDGLLFTGSKEVGLALLRALQPRVPEALHRRDGRQEPGHRHARAPTSTPRRKA